MNKGEKRGMEIEILGWWILAIAVLVISIGIIIVLKGKGTNAIDFIKKSF